MDNNNLNNEQNDAVNVNNQFKTEVKTDTFLQIDENEVKKHIYAFHRYTMNSNCLYCTLVYQFPKQTMVKP